MKVVRLLLALFLVGLVASALSAPAFAARGAACGEIELQIALHQDNPGNALKGLCNALLAPNKCVVSTESLQICNGVDAACDELLTMVETTTKEFAERCDYAQYKYIVELINKFEGMCYDKVTTEILRQDLATADKACQTPPPPTCGFNLKLSLGAAGCTYDAAKGFNVIFALGTHEAGVAICDQIKQAGGTLVYEAQEFKSLEEIKIFQEKFAEYIARGGIIIEPAAKACESVCSEAATAAIVTAVKDFEPMASAFMTEPVRMAVASIEKASLEEGNTMLLMDAKAQVAKEEAIYAEKLAFSVDKVNEIIASDDPICSKAVVYNGDILLEAEKVAINVGLSVARVSEWTKATEMAAELKIAAEKALAPVEALTFGNKYVAPTCAYQEAFDRAIATAPEGCKEALILVGNMEKECFDVWQVNRDILNAKCGI